MADAPTPPMIQARQYSPGGNLPISRIVIHGTVSGCYCGGAKNIALYFSRLADRYASAHYVVDPCEVYQCVNDWDTAYHAPPNPHSLGIEMCDPVSGPDSRWDDADHEAMLDRAAALVRQLCLAYDVPMVWLMPSDLAAGKRGITDHENVSLTWHQTSHTDPQWSTYRSEDFMRRVIGGAAPDEEDDMSEKAERQIDEIHALLADRWDVPWRDDKADNPTYTLPTVIQSQYNYVVETVGIARKLLPKLDAFADTIARMANRDDLSKDDILAQLDESVRAAVAERTIQVPPEQP